MRSFLILIAGLFPYISMAQSRSPRTFSDVVDIVLNINQYIVFLIFAITFLVLLWTIVNAWILNAGNQDTVNKAKGTITISIIVLVVMSGIWGILAILKSTLIGF